MINNEGLTVTRNNHKEEDCQSETKEQRVCPALKQRRTYRFTYKQKEKERENKDLKKKTPQKSFRKWQSVSATNKMTIQEKDNGKEERSERWWKGWRGSIISQCCFNRQIVIMRLNGWERLGKLLIVLPEANWEAGKGRLEKKEGKKEARQRGRRMEESWFCIWCNYSETVGQSIRNENTKIPPCLCTFIFKIESSSQIVTKDDGVGNW